MRADDFIAERGARRRCVGRKLCERDIELEDVGGEGLHRGALGRIDAIAGPDKKPQHKSG
jgi:hypothetical protein